MKTAINLIMLATFLCIIILGFKKCEQSKHYTNPEPIGEVLGENIKEFVNDFKTGWKK